MKKIFIIIIITSLAFTISCQKRQDDWLNKQPTDILLDDQVWSDPTLILSVIGDLYNQIPEFQSLENFQNFANFDEAFPSESNAYNRVRNSTYDYTAWNFWGYGYIRDLNLFIQKDRATTLIDSSDQKRFLAEAQFLRANIYFELVKRMGGVPLILAPLTYDFSGDATYLQYPRSTEAEIYDFVLSELDSAQTNLPKDPSVKSRASWGAAMAMKSRVALYAASIAKYGATTPTVTLPGNIVGIPASLADHYYQIALDAAEALIKSGEYSLYMKYPDDLSKNFSQLFLDKNANPEAIFVKNYESVSRNTTTQFTTNNQPHSLSEEGSLSGFLNPSINLAQSFEKLDNTFAPFVTKDGSGAYIKYDSIGDIFKDRDARLAGTIMLPGSQFKGKSLDIWAGYMLANGTIQSGGQFGQKKVMPGQTTPIQVVGFDGPIDQLQHGTQTGFYLRKYIDPTPQAGQQGMGSAVWWIRYRYAGVLMNAAEAAFELGDNDKAALYINQIRARAGFKTALNPSDITFNRIVHERRVEFAFEGQELWDMKRWRLADKVWNGQSISADQVSQNLASATKNQSMMYGLWPYKTWNSADPEDVQWIFKVVKPSAINSAHQFRLGNYYSAIGAEVLADNPKLVQNPK